MESPVAKSPGDEMRSRAGKYVGGPDVELDLRPRSGFEIYSPMLSHRTDEIGRPFDSQKKELSVGVGREKE